MRGVKLTMKIYVGTIWIKMWILWLDQYSLLFFLHQIRFIYFYSSKHMMKYLTCIWVGYIHCLKVNNSFTIFLKVWMTPPMRYSGIPSPGSLPESLSETVRSEARLKWQWTSRQRQVEVHTGCLWLYANPSLGPVLMKARLAVQWGPS